MASSSAFLKPYVQASASKALSHHQGEDKQDCGSPLMQQELDRQQEDIRFLSGIRDGFDESSIARLKARAADQTPLLPAAFTAR
jgi:hypothetical protein